MTDDENLRASLMKMSEVGLIDMAKFAGVWRPEMDVKDIVEAILATQPPLPGLEPKVKTERRPWGK